MYCIALEWRGLGGAGLQGEGGASRLIRDPLGLGNTPCPTQHNPDRFYFRRFSMQIHNPARGLPTAAEPLVSPSAVTGPATGAELVAAHLEERGGIDALISKMRPEAIVEAFGQFASALGPEDRELLYGILTRSNPRSGLNDSEVQEQIRDATSRASQSVSTSDGAIGALDSRHVSEIRRLGQALENSAGVNEDAAIIGRIEDQVSDAQESKSARNPNPGLQSEPDVDPYEKLNSDLGGPLQFRTSDFNGAANDLLFKDPQAFTEALYDAANSLSDDGRSDLIGYVRGLERRHTQDLMDDFLGPL